MTDPTTHFILEDADGRRDVPLGTRISLPRAGETFAQAAERTRKLRQAAQERRALVIAERIAQADSYLHDVSLPGYGEVVEALRKIHAVADSLTRLKPGGGGFDRKWCGEVAAVLKRLAEVQA